MTNREYYEEYGEYTDPVDLLRRVLKEQAQGYIGISLRKQIQDFIDLHEAEETVKAKALELFLLFRAGNITKEKIEEHHKELIRVLRNDDHFWVKWIGNYPYLLENPSKC